MKDFLENQDLFFTVEVEVEDDNGKKRTETQRRPPKFKGSHVALTAALEQLTRMILSNVLKHTAVDKSGLRTVYRTNLKYSVLLNPGLKQYYSSSFETFDKSQSYKTQIPFKEEELNQIVSSVDKKLMFTPKAYNFFCYLVMKAYLSLMMTSYSLISFAGKKSLDPTCVLAAVNSTFPNTMCHELCTEVNRACTAAKDMMNDEDNEEGENKKESTPPAKETKQTGGKKEKSSTTTATSSTKGGKGSSKTAPIEQDDEDDENVEDEEGEGEDEEVVATKSDKKKGTSTKTDSSSSNNKKTRKTRQA